MIYKNIMLATDGSDVSNCALEEIIKLTKHQKTNVRLVHVVDESFVYYGGPGFDYPSLMASYREEGVHILEKAVQQLASQSSLHVDQRLLELKPFQGRIAEVIVEEAAEWPADLLVIGTHGRRGFSRFFLGSVAENIVRIATTPVLLIRGTEA